MLYLTILLTKQRVYHILWNIPTDGHKVKQPISTSYKYFVLIPNYFSFLSDFVIIMVPILVANGY